MPTCRSTCGWRSQPGPLAAHLKSLDAQFIQASQKSPVVPT